MKWQFPTIQDYTKKADNQKIHFLIFIRKSFLTKIFTPKARFLCHGHKHWNQFIGCIECNQRADKCDYNIDHTLFPKITKQEQTWLELPLQRRRMKGTIYRVHKQIVSFLMVGKEWFFEQTKYYSIIILQLFVFFFCWMNLHQRQLLSDCVFIRLVDSAIHNHFIQYIMNLLQIEHQLHVNETEFLYDKKDISNSVSWLYIQSTTYQFGKVQFQCFYKYINERHERKSILCLH